MALPPLKPKVESKPGLPPLKPRAVFEKITGRDSTAEPMMNNPPRSISPLKKGDEVKLNVELNPKGIFRLATDVIEQRSGDLVLLEWDDPFDHPSCNKRHAWARVSTVEKVKP